MRFILPLLFLLAVSPLLGAGQRDICPQSGVPGGYSKHAVRLCWQSDTNVRRLKVWAPNHRLLLQVKGDRGEIYESGQPLGRAFDLMPDEEWLWSPDSRAAIITTYVTYPTQVTASISFVGDKPRVAHIMDTIQSDFVSRHAHLPCASGVNVAGLTWLRGSEQAVLIAEIPPTPRCEKSDGYFEAYVISVPEGKIIEHYSMDETVARFRSVLGQGLLEDVEAQKEE